MKGIVWLALGLSLSLLLVSGVVVSSQFVWSNSNYFSPAQDLKSIGQTTKQIFGRINKSLMATIASVGNDVSNLLFGKIGETKYGIMVAPATGDLARDEELKKSLRRIFADEVNLKFDQSKLSGVVTPVFRDGQTGRDYIFVLTPYSLK